VLTAIYLKYYSSLVFSETSHSKVYQTVALMLVSYERYTSQKILKTGVCVNFLENTWTKIDPIRTVQWRKLHMKVI
jgi:hypothetical protein